jgi:glutathione S-transferase
MLKIWGRANSSNVQKVLWLCAEGSIDYERIEAGGSFGVTRTPAYLAMNPNAVVPTIDDDGFVLWESNSILRYLANKHRLESWYPTAHQARADIERWMDWASINLAAALTPAYWQLYRTAEDKRDLALVRAQAEKTFAQTRILEAQLTHHRYLCGDTITLADIPCAILVYRWFNMTWSSAGYQAPAQPALRAWFERIAARPAFAQWVMHPLT